MIVTQQDVWTAAAMAYRLNGNTYLKSSTDSQFPNKDLVLCYLTGDTLPSSWYDKLAVTDDDIVLGKKARTAIANTITFKILSDKQLGDFDRTVNDALNIAQWNGIDKFHWSVIASQIAAYFRLLARNEVAKALKDGYLAPIDSKVTTKVTVLGTNYSRTWNVFYVKAKTESGQLVLFTYRDVLDVNTEVTVTGKVKAYRHCDVFGADMTQLSRVRIS